MTLNTCDNQAEKPKTIAPQARVYFLPAGQLKVFRGAQKERKQIYQGYKKASPATSQENASETDASKANATQTGKAQQEASKRR